MGEIKKFPLPLYQADIKLHLGADLVWKRPENRNKHVVYQARGPDAIWEAVVGGLLVELGMAEDRFVLGLLLNIINRWPDEQRIQAMMGILEGWGLTLERDVLAREVIALVGEKRNTEGGLVFGPLMKPTEGGLELPSGLVIPTGANL